MWKNVNHSVIWLIILLAAWLVACLWCLHLLTTRVSTRSSSARAGHAEKVSPRQVRKGRAQKKFGTSIGKCLESKTISAYMSTQWQNKNICKDIRTSLKQIANIWHKQIANTSLKWNHDWVLRIIINQNSTSTILRNYASRVCLFAERRVLRITQWLYRRHSIYLWLMTFQVSTGDV